MILTFVCGEDLACIIKFGLKQSTVTNPAVCHDEVVNQQFAQARPMMMNHLTSS